MPKKILASVVVIISVSTAVSIAQQAGRKANAPTAGRRATAKEKTNADRQADLEKKFKEMLTGVVLRGTWQMTSGVGLKGKAPMTPARPDRYVIKGVSKGVGDHWVITARVQYADKDAILPIDVRVVWAGDTPIITLDKKKLPLLGTYSARVMIYDGFYAGAWFGVGYGGVLSGHIIKVADEEMIKKMEKAAAKKRSEPKR